MREPDARAREASRAGTDDERVEVCGSLVRVGQDRVRILEQLARHSDSLPDHPPVVEEGTRRDIGRGIEGEDEHLRDAL